MASHHSAHKSSEELLIRVDERDRILGYETKGACHEGQGLLHRAFSIFLFDEQGRLLLQQRSAEKLLWPRYWSNSVCSHPRKGERYETAAMRRLHEELGVQASLEFLFRFHYQAAFQHIGSENELCSVYIGRYQGPIQANSHEIAEWKYIEPDELTKDLSVRPERYTPWFQIEWKCIRNEHLDRLEDV